MTAHEIAQQWVANHDRLPPTAKMVRILKGLPDKEAKVLLNIIMVTADGGYGFVSRALSILDECDD